MYKYFPFSCGSHLYPSKRNVIYVFKYNLIKKTFHVNYSQQCVPTYFLNWPADLKVAQHGAVLRKNPPSNGKVKSKSHRRRSLSEGDLLCEIDNALVFSKGFLFARGMSTHLFL